ncbi:Transcription factor TFIIIB component B [Serendipita sp. 399]|nr:Transcription factor TFIIIB component B [Serendipita sp. 399]
MPRKGGPSSEKTRSVMIQARTTTTNKPPSSGVSSNQPVTTTTTVIPATSSAQAESTEGYTQRSEDRSQLETQSDLGQIPDIIAANTRIQSPHITSVPNSISARTVESSSLAASADTQRPAVPLAMPSSSASRGNLIAMPGQRRELLAPITAQKPTTKEPILSVALPPSPPATQAQVSTSSTQAQALVLLASSSQITAGSTLTTSDKGPDVPSHGSTRQKRRLRAENNAEKNREESGKKRKRRKTATETSSAVEVIPATTLSPRKKTGRRSGPTKEPNEIQGEREVSPLREEPAQVTEEGVDEQEENEENDGVLESGEAQKVRRRQRRPRPRVDKAVQEVPDEGPPLDETTATMMDLCNGVGQGRVSGRFLETFIKRNEDAKRKREENTRLRDFARRKELGLQLEDQELLEMSAQSRRGRIVPLVETTDRPEDGEESAGVANEEEEGEDDEYAGVAQTTNRAPQVRYDASGNLVLDEAELEYNRQEEAEAELAAHGPMEVIVETDRDKFTNFASYSRKPKPERWTKEEMDTFYMVSLTLALFVHENVVSSARGQGLRMFHTGFDLIARLLPNRTRTMVRNKFRTEDRKNPEKITKYLSHQMRLPYGGLSDSNFLRQITNDIIDLELLSRETGCDFNGPPPSIEEPPTANLTDEREEEDEGDKEDDLSLKRRLSTAPLSGGESDRGEGTSVSTTARGRMNAHGKGKQKTKQTTGTSKPPSTVMTRGTSVGVASAAANSEGPETAQEGARRPPMIASSSTNAAASTSSGSTVPKIRTMTSMTMGKNTLVLPGGGREFRRED